MIKKNELNINNNNLSKLKEKNTEVKLIDSNDDGIPDEWSINGYTVENGLITAWNENEHLSKGLTKYTSDPYRKSTTGDPYFDIDKVLGKIDEGVLSEARHPLVAAYPQIGLEMEKLILTKNAFISGSKEEGETKSHSKTISVETSSSTSESDKVSVSTEVGLSAGFIPTFSSSIKYSHEHSTTVSVTNTDSSTSGISQNKNWTEGLEINSADTAFLGGNIRYINSGTAPIYHAMPTLNFVLGSGKDSITIATIIAKVNTAVDCLLPNKVYPEKGQNAVVWNTSDDFNSQPIKLNFDQVKTLTEGNKIHIQTTQTSGYYKKYNFNEKVEISESQKWEYHLNDIYNRTACISILLKNGQFTQRRVAARSIFNYEQQSQPIITLGKALEIAFTGASIKQTDQLNGLFYKDLSFWNINIIFDQTDKALIQNSFDEIGVFDIYQIQLKQGLNILIQELDQDQARAVREKELEKIFSVLEKFQDINWFKIKKGVGISFLAIVFKIKTYLLENDFNLMTINNLKLSSLDTSSLSWESSKRDIEFSYGDQKINFKKTLKMSFYGET